MLIQSQNHALRPLTTAHLAQTMTLLELTGVELRQKIEAELSSNPALELVEERRCPTCHRRLNQRGPCPVCSRPVDRFSDQPIVFVSNGRDFNYSAARRQEDENEAGEWTASTEDLPTYILRQIAPELDPNDRPLAAHILTSLNEDGLLDVPLLEIARYHHVPMARVERVLRQIQRADPAGAGSPSPQDALLVQLELLAEVQPVPCLAERAIREGMDLLSRRAYGELARLLGTSTFDAQEVARFISSNLYPFPGRAHWGDTGQKSETPPVYHEPDIIVSALDESENSALVIEVLSPYAGSLRVNPLFREALPHAPAEKSEAWQADLEQASLLVKCVQQRDHTLVRLMRRLAVIQREFFFSGDACLVPLTRARLAEELDVHESTISRAVSGKSLQLPNRRIVPLSKLFDRSLHVRTALLQIIASETEPLSDTQIADRLLQQGFPVARRTVAKYRAMEGILPARFRQAEVRAAIQ